MNECFHTRISREGESLSVKIDNNLTFDRRIGYMCKKATRKLGVLNTKAIARRCSVKIVFLKISQNSPENTCTGVSFLIKLQAAPATLLKKRFRYRCFPVNFAKILKTRFFIEHLRWLLL